MGSSDRSRRKSAHVKSKLGPPVANGSGRGPGSQRSSGSGGGSVGGPAPKPEPEPGPGPARKFIEVEIEEVKAAMAKRIKLGMEVLFLYGPVEIAVVWHQERLGRVASKHEGAVREHRPLAASITRLPASGQRMRAKFRARA